MGETIKYDESAFSNMQEIFNENNEKIINSLKIILDEISGIKNVLDTPKSGKVYPQYEEYLIEKAKLVIEKKEVFNKMFNTIKKDYSDYLEEISQSL